MKKQKDPGKKFQDGFTLIEIMIAITVFAIGLLAINIMQTTSIKGNSAAKWNSLRTNLASDQIEGFMVTSYDDIDADITATPTITTTDPVAGDIATTTRTFTPDTPANNLATITVTVVDVTDTATPADRPTIFTYIKSNSE